MIVEQIINSFLVILWWVSCWGLITSLIDLFKFKKKFEVLIYFSLVLISLFLIYLRNKTLNILA